MKFNYAKLLGRIREKGYTQERIAASIGTAEGTVSKKLNNKCHFYQPEIAKICDLLDIADGDVGAYFFTPEVEKNSTFSELEGNDE